MSLCLSRLNRIRSRASPACTWASYKSWLLLSFYTSSFLQNFQQLQLKNIKQNPKDTFISNMSREYTMDLESMRLRDQRELDFQFSVIENSLKKSCIGEQDTSSFKYHLLTIEKIWANSSTAETTLKAMTGPSSWSRLSTTSTTRASVAGLSSPTSSSTPLPAAFRIVSASTRPMPWNPYVLKVTALLLGACTLRCWESSTGATSLEPISLTWRERA